MAALSFTGIKVKHLATTVEPKRKMNPGVTGTVGDPVYVPTGLDGYALSDSDSAAVSNFAGILLYDADATNYVDIAPPGSRIYAGAIFTAGTTYFAKDGGHVPWADLTSSTDFITATLFAYSTTEAVVLSGYTGAQKP